MRKYLGLFLCAVLVLAPISALAWHFSRGGGFAQFITYITSSLTSSAATSFMALGPTGNCPFAVAVADIPALSNTITATAAEIAAGDFAVGSVIGGELTGVQGGYTVIGVNASTDVLTLNAKTTNATDEPNTAIVVTPPYPTQWTWLPSATTNQPQGAENAAGTVLATGTTVDGNNTITGLAIVSGSVSPLSAIVAGDQIYGQGVPAGATVQGISGTTVTMTMTTGAADTSAGAGQQVLFSPFAPLIHQYHTGSPGVLATGYISGTTFTVSSLASGAFAIGDLLTGTGINPATTIISGSGSTWQVSVSQTVASAGAPEAIDGTVQATTYTEMDVAFKQNGSTTWVAGDTFIVDPAIYTDLDNNTGGNDPFLGPGNQGNVCYQDATETENSATITCTTVSGAPQIGDYVDHPSPSPYGIVYYPPDTTVTNIQPNTPSAGVTTFTFSNAYTGPPVTTGTVEFDPPFQNITIWGGTANDSNGAPTRPVIQQFNLGGPGNNTAGQGAVYFGGDGFTGENSGDTMGNIDINVPSTITTIGGTAQGLLYLAGPMSGTNTFEDMRITGGVYEQTSGYGENGIIGGDDLYARAVTISGTITAGDKVSIDFWNNGDSSCVYTAETDAGKITYTVLGGDTAADVAAGLVQAFVTYVTANSGGPPWSDAFRLYAKGNVLLIGLHTQICTAAAVTTTGTETLTTAPGYSPIAGATETGTVNLLNLELAYDGGNPGAPRHGIYMGDNPALTVNIENSWFHDNYWGHDYKSRAGVNNIIGNYFESNEITFYTYTGGEANNIDLSCGGQATIKNNIFTKTVTGYTTGGNNIRYDAEYPEACLHLTNTLDVHNNTFADFSATYDGQFGNTPINVFGVNYYNDTAGPLVTCTNAAVMFSGDNIVEVPTADLTGYCQLDVADYIVDNTTASTIPANTWLANSGISNQGRTCPVNYGCSFMSNNATAASASGGDSITIQGRFTMMPGDQGWPLTAANSWDIKNNLFAGMCPAQGTAEPAATPNAGLNIGNLGWYGTQPSNSGGSVGIEVVQALSELSEIFSPTPKYAPSGDTSNVGAVDYQHAAQSGGIRAYPTLGAVD